jgi:hypothetical protein
VTYAFEAAGEMASGIEEQASSAMRRISAIGAAEPVVG